MATTGQKIENLLEQRISDITGKRGTTQKEMADALGFTPATISRWIKGVANISEKNLPKVADYLGVKPEDLESDPPTDEEKLLKRLDDFIAQYDNVEIADYSTLSEGEKSYLFYKQQQQLKTYQEAQKALDDRKNKRTEEIVQSVKGAVESALDYSLRDWSNRLVEELQSYEAKTGWLSAEVDKLKSENQDLRNKLNHEVEKLKDEIRNLRREDVKTGDLISVFDNNNDQDNQKIAASRSPLQRDEKDVREGAELKRWRESIPLTRDELASIIRKISDAIAPEDDITVVIPEEFHHKHKVRTQSITQYENGTLQIPDDVRFCLLSFCETNKIAVPNIALSSSFVILPDEFKIENLSLVSIQNAHKDD